jgi:parallel beta-helix repeat protein
MTEGLGTLFSRSLLAVLSFTIGLMTANVSSGATLCVNATAASCASTVQAAVDAASPGDLIEIAPGLYQEAVWIGVPGLALRGKRGVFIDPSGLPGRPDAITVAADDVTLERIGVRNGEESGIHGIDAARLRIVAVDIQSTDDVCIRLDGDTPDARVERSRIQGCKLGGLSVEQGDGLQLLGNSLEGMDDSGTRIAGDRVVASGNILSGINGPCLSIDGKRAVVTGNRLRVCNIGISVTGDDALVRRNLVFRVGESISVSGKRPVIERNHIEAAQGVGIQVRCDSDCNGRIVGNRLLHINSTGISARPTGPGLLLRANRISQTMSQGIVLVGSGASIEGSQVDGAGAEGLECILIVGDSNRVVGNSLSACSGDGIGLESGDQNLVEDNRVSDTGDDGIAILSGAGNALRGNRITGANDNGIQISPLASATLVSGNHAVGIRAGYCDGGVGSTGPDEPDATIGCGSVDD